MPTSYITTRMSKKTIQFYKRNGLITVGVLTVACSLLFYLAFTGNYTQLEYVWLTIALGGQIIGFKEVIFNESNDSGIADDALALCVLTAPFLGNDKLLIYSIITLLTIFSLQLYFGYCLLTNKPWSAPVKLLSAVIGILLILRLLTHSPKK